MIVRMLARALPAIALGLPAVIVACGDRDASSVMTVETSSADDQQAGERDLTEPIPPDATVERVVELKAKKYAAGLIAEGAQIAGSMAEGARSDHLLVLRAGHCYRVVGAGGDGVQDMDFFLYDPQGVQIQQDPAEDRYPVLGLQAEICPPANGAYRLQIHMYKGSGPFAAGVYRTP